MNRVVNTVPFDTLPDEAFVRISQLCFHPGRRGLAVPLPFSSPTLWRKVNAGTFPKPTKLSERVTAWRAGEIREWLKSQREAEYIPTGGAERKKDHSIINLLQDGGAM